MKSFHTEVADHIATLVFDVPGEKVNTFTACRLRELEDELEAIAGRKDVRALLLRSAKPGIFVAGADLREFGGLHEPSDAFVAARAGQIAFARLASLPFPVFAVIDGACLGGGCEMAMACDFRIATDSPRTRIGLPETKLGILPGWGGTQRLPRLVGLSAALDLVLAGRDLDARKAWKLGLIDRVCAAEFLEEAVASFVAARLAHGKSRTGLRREPGLRTRLLDRTPCGQLLLATLARRKVMSGAGRNLPGLPDAITLLAESAARVPLAVGLEHEARAFSVLPGSPQSRALVETFFASEEAKAATLAVGPRPTELRQAGVLGAGIMGGGIAWAFSARGIPVRMRDLDLGAIGRGYGAAMAANRSEARRGGLSDDALRLRMHRIRGGLGWEGFGSCDLVVEAVVEDLDIKRKVLAEAEAHVRPDCVIATNTSSLRLADMESALQRPERLVGLHFFNPVPRMPLVEVVRGPSSAPEVVECALRAARRLGKTPVLVADGAGFLVNRILLPYVNEAVKILDEGATTARIDRLVRDWGMPMGPLTLADAVGLDVGFKVAKVLHHAYGARMSVSPLLAEVHDRLKLRGDKGGAGFWIDKGFLRRPNPLVEAFAAGRRGGSGRRIPSEEIVDRCVLTMVAEAGRCLAEGVVASARLLDLAMVMGTGWPAWRGGPVQEARRRGRRALRARLEDLAETCGARFAPDDSLDALF